MTQVTNHTQLSGRWLTIARAMWGALVIVILSLATLHIPVLFDVVNTPCAGPRCDEVQLTSDEVRSLQQVGISLRSYAGLRIGATILIELAWAIPGFLLFLRKSDDWLALFVSFTLIAFVPSVMSGATRDLALVYPALHLPAGMLETLGMTSLIMLFYLFPNGRFAPRWTRFLAGLVVVFAIANTIRIALIQLGGYYAPFSFSLALPVFGLFFIGIVVQIHRYARISMPVERQQTKWVVLGFIGPFMVGLWHFLNQTLVWPGSGTATIYYRLVSLPIGSILMFSLPLSIVFSILRYRLWDIDVLINRTLVYSALTSTLALVYFGSVIVLQRLLPAESQLAVVLSTLAIAAMFNPLRRRIQDLIDRRFYRRKYDAQQVLAAFAETARDETDLDRLTDELLAVVEETMQPAHVSLWLRPVADRERPQP